MLYDANSPALYAPLWPWSGRHFVHLRPSAVLQKTLKPRAVPLRATRDTTGVPDAWVVAEWPGGAPPVALHLRHDSTGCAAYDGIRPLLGPFWWGLPTYPCTSVRFGVHTMHKGPLPSALVRRYGNKNDTGDAWPHDPTVRQFYSEDVTEECALVLLPDGTALACLPDLQGIQPMALRTAAIWAARDALLQLTAAGLAGASCIGVPWRREVQHCMPDANFVAFRQGAVKVHGAPQALRWNMQMLHEVCIGDRTPPPPLGGISPRGCLRTNLRIGPPEHHGLFWMYLDTVDPSQVKNFNQRTARFPHYLYSLEVLRIRSAFSTLYRLYNVRELEDKCTEENYTLTTGQHTAYYCIDRMHDCFAPVPHIWFEDSDARFRPRASDDSADSPAEGDHQSAAPAFKYTAHAVVEAGGRMFGDFG